MEGIRGHVEYTIAAFPKCLSTHDVVEVCFVEMGWKVFARRSVPCKRNKHKLCRTIRADSQPSQYVWNVQCPTHTRGTKVIIHVKSKVATSLHTKEPDIESMTAQQKKNFFGAAANPGQI